MAREDDSFTPPVRLCPHAQHLIVYIMDDTGVYILRILHGSMNIPDHI